MDLRLREKSWRLMLAVNVAVVTGVFFYKLARPPYVPYIHLLVDYHFGFTKRALIGAIVSLFAAKVPIWLVFALAGGAWLVTLWLFIVLFRRTFGLGEPHLPLFVFMVGSPFFFKNFMHTLGHFDIYGCAFALGLMLVPARSVVFVMLAALSAMILILIHHIHLLMYVPTIAVIVVLRHYLVAGLNRSNLLIGAASVLGVGLLFAAAQFYGTVTVPPETFVHYLQGRMAEPSRTDLLAFQLHLVPAAFQGNSRHLATHAFEPARRSRLRAADRAACAALALFCRIDPCARGRAASPRRGRRAADGQRGLSDHLCHRVRLFALGLELGGLPVPDSVCGETLPASREVPPIPAGDRTTSVLGWIVTILPRVGIVRPF